MADPFENHATKLESPGTRHFPIVPSDTQFLAVPPRAIYVNVSGAAALEDGDGVVIIYNLTAGQIMPFRWVRVRQTGTNAALIGWY